ncbi:MAG TPA: cytochrome c [Gillisia sp.]|nr:cytochrome c [Gillisia sp.]
MKKLIKSFSLLAVALLMFSCGNSEKEQKDNVRIGDYSEAPDKEVASTDPMQNKGIGPIKTMNISEEIDAEMATRGAELFKNMCSACHKMDKKFVGPEVGGVTERRTHEWIMNMILNPEQMIKEDPIAKKLLIESNMAVMANQNLKEDEARAILEYFRQYDRGE